MLHRFVGVNQRVVEATKFLEKFCSDRMHMFNAQTNEWNAPPPKYDCIKTNDRQGQTSNLKEYISMKQQMEGESWVDESGMGSVLSLEQLQLHFCGS